MVVRNTIVSGGQAEDLRQRAFKAIVELGGSADLAQDALAEVLGSYQHPNRIYHALPHIEKLAQPLEQTEDYPALQSALGNPDADALRQLNAEKLLAVIGHDCVYQMTDQGLGECSELLEPYLESTTPAVLKPLSAFVPGSPEQRTAALVYPLFDVANSQEAREIGARRNECLSALVTADMLLRAGVPVKNVASIVCQIEGTIPFRDANDKQQSHFVQLKERLQNANTALDLGLTPQDLQQRITLATHLANEDIANFKGDLGNFVHNTFILSCEKSPALRGEYPDPQEYLAILQDNLNFMNFLAAKPARVFHDDGNGYPGEETMARYTDQVSGNLQKSATFLKAKLVPTMFVYAMTERLGFSDRTIREIMPDLRLPRSSTPPPSGPNQEVYQLLTNGTGRGEVALTSSEGETVTFDIASSPMTRYFWDQLGEEKLLAMYEQLKPAIKEAAAMTDPSQVRVGDLIKTHRLFQTELGPEMLNTVYDTIKNQTDLKTLTLVLERNKSLITGKEGTMLMGMHAGM